MADAAVLSLSLGFVAAQPDPEPRRDEKANRKLNDKPSAKQARNYREKSAKNRSKNYIKFDKSVS